IARPGPIPAKAGIGLRAQHHRAIMESRPAVGWLEAHSENYFAPGGPQPHILERIRAEYPLSLHGVGLSLGTIDELDREHLANLKRIVGRFEPALVSEHLSWGAIHGTHFNDLLPLPYTREALAHMVARVVQVQEFLGRQILVENVSSYLQFTGAEMTEWEFLAALARESGCGLLLDVNNVYVNAHNHGLDAHAFIGSLPVGAVQEMHLAGHARNPGDGRDILIDTHGSHVCEEVWSLYEAAVRRFGDVPALIEWDTDIPALDVLVAEAARADSVREKAHALAA
ncbi:MAG TPA: DUF692 domain-containing protein, partial [Steroidobacteraceae bacterium]|nr:DUF692 domain-containing protein [Steroidobacteraceae bacterium]